MTKNLHQGHLIAMYCTKLCITLIQLQTKIASPLHEIVPLLIHFHFSAKISVGPDVGRPNLIAIGDTKIFKTLSSSDLAGCRRLGQTFSCLNWAMTLANFLDHKDTEQLMHKVKKIKSKISGTFDANEILQRLDIFFNLFYISLSNQTTGYSLLQQV